MVWGECQRRGARILTITVGHIQSYIHKEMRAEREKIFFTSILLSCSWAWAIVTLTMESLHTEPFYHLIKLTGFLLTLTDMHEEIICVAEGRIKSVWGVWTESQWSDYNTFRTRSWSSIMPRSLPAACAILFPATRFPTITDAGPTPTAGQKEHEKDEKSMTVKQVSNSCLTGRYEFIG